MSSLNRLTHWCLMILTTIGLVPSIAIFVIVVASLLGPEPGDRMVLMGLPFVVMPTAPTTLGLLATVGLEGLARWERQSAIILIGLVVACDTAVFLILATAGAGWW